MKEMLKSKSIILFIFIMIGGIMISPSTELDENKVEDSYLVYNMQ